MTTNHDDTRVDQVNPSPAERAAATDAAPALPLAAVAESIEAQRPAGELADGEAFPVTVAGQTVRVKVRGPINAC